MQGGQGRPQEQLSKVHLSRGAAAEHVGPRLRRSGDFEAGLPLEQTSKVYFRDAILPASESDEDESEPSEQSVTAPERRASAKAPATAARRQQRVDRQKLIIILVGLPGRGKTFLCNKLMCYLNWCARLAGRSRPWSSSPAWLTRQGGAGPRLGHEAKHLGAHRRKQRSGPECSRSVRIAGTDQACGPHPGRQSMTQTEGS